MANEIEETIIDDQSIQVILSPTENLLQQLIPEGEVNPNNITISKEQSIDCACEKTFWKYARCILWLNLILSNFRIFIYMVIGLFRLIFCHFRQSKEAAKEVLESILVMFSAAAAIYVSQNIVEIDNCIVEVFYEFIIGGLTLQICLGLGDALIHLLCGCNTSDCTIHKIVESILEPIVFIGGFFSVFTYCKSVKGSKDAQRAKYAAIGNLVGSSIVIILAIVFCFHIEEKAMDDMKKTAAKRVAENNARKEAYIRELNDTNQELSHLAQQLNVEYTPLEMNWTDFTDSVKDLYDVKQSILAMNVFARIFTEGIAKCVEHKYFHRHQTSNDVLI